MRRLKASFSDAESSGAGFFVFKNQWSGDHLDFRASMLGQSTTGTVDVAEDHAGSSSSAKSIKSIKWICISEMTSIGLFRHGCLHHEGI
jgi:hypothetical protein